MHPRSFRSGHVYTVGPVLNAWFNDCVLRFFAYIANSMIACGDAAAYGVLLLDLLLRVQMIANPGKTRNAHLIDTRNQNQSYGNITY